MPAALWHCSMCRAPIEAGVTYYRCSVASCNAGRMKLRFCSPGCFDAHIPTARHRKAECVEDVAGARDA